MILAKNDGAFPKDYQGDKAPGYLGLQSTDETPFDTRYFTVTYDAAGKPRKFNLVKTELVSTPEEALEYCDEAFSEKKTAARSAIIVILFTATGRTEARWFCLWTAIDKSTLSQVLCGRA